MAGSAFHPVGLSKQTNAASFHVQLQVCTHLILFFAGTLAQKTKQKNQEEHTGQEKPDGITGNFQNILSGSLKSCLVLLATVTKCIFTVFRHYYKFYLPNV